MKNFFLFLIRGIYWTIHFKKCPERSLTDLDVWRYCFLCGRMRFTTKEAKRKFQTFLNNGGQIQIQKGRALTKNVPDRTAGKLGVDIQK